MKASEKLSEAFRLFDAANALDPNRETVAGIEHPKELLYAQRMTQTLNEFALEASEALQLTVRCQHIRRWEIPRNSYPIGRIGYLQWRKDLKKFHAEKAGEILHKVGYDDETIARVQFLLQKKQLKKDVETQTLENVICLVFLNYYYEAFLKKHNEEKIIAIIQKTWKKMSPKGHEVALNLSYSEEGKALLLKSISDGAKNSNDGQQT